MFYEPAKNDHGLPHGPLPGPGIRARPNGRMNEPAYPASADTT